MTILYLTSRFPFPLDKGDKLRAYHQIVELSKKADIILCSITEEDTPRAHIDALMPHVKELNLMRMSHASRIKSILKAFTQKIPFQTAWFYSTEIHDQLEQIAKRTNPDIIFYQLARMAKYKLGNTSKHILDYMDAFGVGMKRRAKITKGLVSWVYNIEAKRMKAYEKEIASNFDVRFIISQQDAAQLNLGDSAIVMELSNGVDESFFKYDKPINKTYDVTFIGNMSYLPNVDAAEVLVREILPLCNSNLKVEIAGTSPHKRVRDLRSSNVTITGYVEDIRDAYGRGKIFCAPLWSGTGQQNKILEAMAMGIPCVTTPAVNKAIGALNGHEIIVVDTPDEFATAIAKLLNDVVLNSNISMQARIFVKEKYSWGKQVEQIL